MGDGGRRIDQKRVFETVLSLGGAARRRTRGASPHTRANQVILIAAEPQEASGGGGCAPPPDRGPTRSGDRAPVPDVESRLPGDSEFIRSPYRLSELRFARLCVESTCSSLHTCGR